MLCSNKIGKVDAKEFCGGGGHDAVEEDLGGDNVCIWCVYITIIENEVATNGPLNAKMIYFLGGGAILCTYTEICGGVSLRE